MRKTAPKRDLCFLLFLILLSIFFISATNKAIAKNKPSTRIAGGKPAKADAWPWAAHITIKENQGDFSTCGGALIQEEWVLTAAHCIKNAQDITVTLGRNDLLTLKGEKIQVEKWYSFPFYNDELTASDIALLKLEHPAKQANISVIEQDDPQNILTSGKMGTTIGWGLTDPGNFFSQSTLLMQVDLPVIDDDQALETTVEYAYAHWNEIEHIFGQEPEDVFSEQNLQLMRQTMFFAGYLYKPKDACIGDSGGPFMLKNDKGEWVLAGLVSWGFKDAAKGAYGAFTRVSNFSYWIDDLIKGNRVLDYLENTFTDYTGTIHGQSQITTIDNLSVLYRYYKQKNAFLALSHGQIFYYGPQSNYEFVNIESIDYWLPLAREAGY